MRYSDNINPDVDKLQEEESYVSSCDNCGKWLIINKVADAISREHIDDERYTNYKCLCGEEFSIKD